MFKDNFRRKMLILHVLKSSIYSGAENVVISIIKQLSDQFDFVYIATEGPIRQVLEKERIPFCLLERFDRGRVRKAIKKYDPDIIHAHDFTASIFCAVAGGRYRLISHLHYDPPWVRTWNMKSLAYVACYRRIDMILAVSKKMFQYMVFSGIYRNRVWSIGNPINAVYIRRMASDIPKEKEIRAYNLIFVGRLEEQKDPKRFIRLIHRLKVRGWDSISAIMLGDGRLRTECERLIADLKLEGNIWIEGFKKNPYPYISAAWLLCATSQWEGFGLVAAEANILGVPVVTTATAGSLEIFGQDALEICRTDEDFIRKIEMLHEDENEYKIWCIRAEKRAESLDNTGAYMESMVEIYRRKESH